MNGTIPRVQQFPEADPSLWVAGSYPVDSEVLGRAAFLLDQGGTIDNISLLVPPENDPDAETFPNLTAALAQAGVPTTELPRDPGEKAEFKKHWLADREVDKLADNLLAFTAGIKAFENVHPLERIRSILSLFNNIRDARFDGVHLEGEVMRKVKVKQQDGSVVKEKLPDGTVVFDHIQLFMDSQEEAILLDDILSAWLQSEKPEHARAVNHHVNFDDQGVATAHVVDIKNMNEFDWHMLEIGCERLMARWLKATAGTTLPVNKGTLKDWVEKDGETFNNRSLYYLRRVANGYKKMIVGLNDKVTYWGKYAPKARPRIDADPFGTTPAPVFEVARKVRNGIVDQLEARQGNNPVQHKSKGQRLRVEYNVGIQRTLLDHSQPIRPRAPGGVHALTWREKGQGKVAEAQENVSGTAKAVGREAVKRLVDGVNLLGVGVEVGLAMIPVVRRVAGSTLERRRTWREQDAAAHSEATRLRIIEPLGELPLQTFSNN
jgi:hypothetical protein